MTPRWGRPPPHLQGHGALSILAAAAGAALLWWAGALSALNALGCGQMPFWACSTDAVPAAAAVLAGATAVRATWLGVTAARRVRALAHVPTPPALRAAGAGIRTARVVCLTTSGQLAFCAGLWRPRLYVSLGAVQRLAADELAAVLAHEDAHARRRDPLRGLLRRAAADVLFFAPLARHWDHRRRLRAELVADRAAVHRAGAPALAGALLGMVATAPAGAAAFGPAAGSAIDARIAALTDTPAPTQPIPLEAGAMTMLGTLATTVLILCLAPLTIALGLH
ncbi:M56 family metallopeptidase [Pseudonocardia sp. KRD291]|uniref:M56 family metallopeptidase n=1 Tax=Pseudonocardia sp. KRD291 TaxID=2792007 RepID=UPI001C49E619|nr:M56 family metallopeptidase [Pseudonocardia sp. KRD291]MBW0106059.1 M56 family metallopeptidase [Pseudonocardia sp. KRD291]